MSRLPAQPRPRIPALLFVAFLVQLEALWQDPRLYLQCVWWRITGKRLRARMRFAPLVGRTPHAYTLWLARHPAPIAAPKTKNPPRIVALVLPGRGQEATLDSLSREAVEAIVVAPDGEVPCNQIADAEWLMPLESGDCLAHGAGAWYRAAAAAASPEAVVIYADDDLVDHEGRRCAPHFKPDWNSELFRHFDYLSGAAMIRNAAVAPLSSDPTDWSAGLLDRAIEAAKEQDGEAVIHLRHVLHHRQARPEPKVPVTPAISAAEDRVLPTVSVIIPTRNRVDLLAACLESFGRTRYPTKPEIIVIDNGSDDPATLEYLAALDSGFARVVRDDGPFNFSALNNRAERLASGALLCFLNNDVEIADPEWLVMMARQAVRKDVGAVGAQLLYPDGRIQHAGVTIGIGGAAGHAHRLLDPSEEGYFRRHALPQFVSAVTAACMLVERDKFAAVGGFDAERFAVSFNDVDLCLRLNARGWQSLYEPRARLVHHESVSRGFDRDPAGAARQAAETANLQQLWGTRLAPQAKRGQGAARDPFHHPALSQFSEQFVPAL